jgi:hypothetical protein
METLHLSPTQYNCLGIEIVFVTELPQKRSNLQEKTGMVAYQRIKVKTVRRQFDDY